MKTTVDLTRILPENGLDISERVGMLPNVASKRTRELKGRIAGAKAVTSVCCYCAVGCSTLAYVSDDGKLLDVEGNPDSPINAGHLCPKGSALFGLDGKRPALDDRKVSRSVLGPLRRPSASMGAGAHRATDERRRAKKPFVRET